MLEKAYDPKAVEDGIYKKWEESGAFKPSGNGEPFTISMPPPNATGQLHLGHAARMTTEDILTRFARMNGKRTLWVPGTDHAAIATENVVIKRLREGGMKDPRKELGRDGLLSEIAKFVESSKNTIRSQVRKMGASCDWSRERYTFEPALNRCVNEVFKKMYADGLIYRGHRIVNWDPKLETTVSDDEVVYKEEKAPFFTFKYGPFEIGTSRPETKFGDKYVVMHPDDKRYKKYKHGETFEAEWINGKVRATIIKDKSVDPEFGTGVMTITPWHDHADFEIAERHGLEKEQIIGFDGRLLEVAGEFKGMKIDAARPLIVEKLKSKGLLVKVDENYVHNKAVGQRGGGVLEPQIKLQWFIDVNKKVVEWKNKKMSLKEIMHAVVHKGDIALIPDRFEKTYFHWIDNLRDWCISRQIWWGHRIPVWYDEAGKIFLEAPQKILFARHGQSEGNAAKRIQSDEEALTADGLAHAKKLAESLKGRTIGKIISSPAKRALDTAKIVADALGLQVEVWNELNQIDFGPLTGKPEPKDKLSIEWAIEEKAGEGIDAFFKRSKKAWEKLQKEQAAGDILVVSHRTNTGAIMAIRDGKGKDAIIENRRENDKAGFGLLAEISLGEAKGALTQDPDTLDTWFSSALWTWSTLVDPKLTQDMSLSLEDILKKSPDFQTFHPTSVMETAYDILFFWVARMILMTTYAIGDIPFKTVYLSGLIRTREGKKMSKSDPETAIDPLEVISEFGADALRLSMIIGVSAGNDARLYKEKIAGYRNFVNKLWNASRFVLLQCEQAKIDPHSIEKLPELSSLSLADRAVLHASEELIENVTKLLANYELSGVGETLYSFVWDYFCDWYLELSKGNANCAVLVHVLRRILRLLHPYCPFVTEELWGSVKPKSSDLLISEKWPEVKKERKDKTAFEELQRVIDVISAVRKLRAEQNVEAGKKISVFIHSKKFASLLESQKEHVMRMGNVETLAIDAKPVKHENSASAYLKETEVHLSLAGLFDPAKLKESLSKEQAELSKYVSSLSGKLSNKGFVERAPAEVVEAEKAKLAEAEEKLQKIEERLKQIK